LPGFHVTPSASVIAGVVADDITGVIARDSPSVITGDGIMPIRPLTAR